MPTRKLWDYAIEVKKGFVLSGKGKIYLLIREERRDVTTLSLSSGCN